MLKLIPCPMGEQTAPKDNPRYCKTLGVILSLDEYSQARELLVLSKRYGFGYQSEIHNDSVFYMALERLSEKTKEISDRDEAFRQAINSFG